MGLERTCRGCCVTHQGRACSGLKLRAVWAPMTRAGNALVLVLLTPESALVQHGCSQAGGQAVGFAARAVAELNGRMERFGSAM